MSTPRYQPPASLQVLIKSVHKAIKDYKGDRTEEPELITKVLSQIESDFAPVPHEDSASKKIREDNATERLLGSLFFIREFINDSYKLPGSSYVPSTVRAAYSFFSSLSSVECPYNSKRSEFYNLIDHALLLDRESNKDKKLKNTLDGVHPENGNDPTKFICLAAFLNYLENYSTLVNERVRVHIKKVTREAKDALAPNIKKLCDRLSAEKLMHENTTQLTEEYKKVCAEDYFSADSIFSYFWGRKIERMECLEFINVLEADLIRKNVPEKDRDFIIKGAAVKYMAEIESELKYKYILSPEGGIVNEGSTVYKLLQKKTGFKHSSEFVQYTELYLSSLDKALCEIVTSPDQLAFWAKQKITLESLEKAKADISKLRHELAQAKKGFCTGNRTTDSIVNWLFNNITASIVQTGVLCAGVAVTTNSSISFSSLLVAASAYPQFAVASAGIVWAVNHLRTPVTSAITSVITPVVNPVLVRPVNAALSRSTTKTTLFKPSPKMSPEMVVENERLIKALLFSSDDICSPAEKQKILALLGTNMPEMAVGPSGSDTTDAENTTQGSLSGLKRLVC